MRLNDIRDNKGARVPRVRVGRGVGSGLGKTAGSGQKGQKSRTGVSINGFEGGQMPLTRRLPKRGFNPLVRKDIPIVNLGDIQKAIEAGRLDIKNKITKEHLQSAGLVRRNKGNVRLLGDGVFSSKIDIEVISYSQKAKELVEKAGGVLHLVKEKLSSSKESKEDTSKKRASAEKGKKESKATSKKETKKAPKKE